MGVPTTKSRSQQPTAQKPFPLHVLHPLFACKGLALIIVIAMAKDPAFLFYPADYLSGTMGFTLEQHGAYIMMLIYQFNNDSFTEIEALNIVGEIWHSIKNKFTKKNDNFYNKRLKFEKEKRKKYSESRSNNRKNNELQKKHMKNICNSYEKHMENENINRNINRNDLKEGDHKGGKKHTHGEYRHVLLTDDQFNKLNDQLGETETQEMITELDNGIEMKGYRYKNHYLAILKWHDRKMREPKKPKMMGLLS